MPALIEIMNLRGPQGFIAAIAAAAARQNLSHSEFARLAILERIERAGVAAPRPKGNLKEGRGD